MKRGFTLIELLVVIAIIAILAAILFPVFAQAKAAAKGTASLSNSKQLGLGMVMYAGDVDDHMPLAAVWNSGSDPLQFQDGTGVSPWSWLIQPYVKNGGIYVDPTNTPTPALGPGISTTLSEVFVPEYGYNYTFLSPVFQNSDKTYYMSPVSSTVAGDPAGTVMLASKWGYTEGTTSTGNYWSFGLQTPAFWATVEVPDCTDAPNLCSSNWGAND